MAQDHRLNVFWLMISGLFLCCQGFYINEPEVFEPFELLCELFKKNTSISDIPEKLKPTYFKAIDQCKNFSGLEKDSNQHGTKDSSAPKPPSDSSLFDYEGPVMVIKSEWIQVIPLVDEYELPIDYETINNFTKSSNKTTENQGYVYNNTRNSTEGIFNNATNESTTKKPPTSIENVTLTDEPVNQHSWNSSTLNNTYYRQNISESYNSTNADNDQETKKYTESFTITEGDKKKLEYEPFFEDWPPKSPLSYEYSKAYYPNSNQIPFDKYKMEDEYLSNSIQSPRELAVSY